MTTLHRLPVEKYADVRPLLAGLDRHLAVQALLAGAVPGVILVDRLQQPQAVAAWVRRRIYLGGQPDAECAAATAAYLAQESARQQQASSSDSFVIHYDSQGWEAHVDRLWSPKLARRAVRQVYELQLGSTRTHSNLPAGFALRDVDADLLADGSLQGRELVRQEMCSERTSVANFLAHSFGVCAVTESVIAGWCLSEYNLGSACEVGIETQEAYQRRGIGVALTLALAERARSRGMQRLGWHCSARNLASAATAISAGFALVEEYPVLAVWLPAAEAAN